MSPSGLASVCRQLIIPPLWLASLQIYICSRTGACPHALDILSLSAQVQLSVNKAYVLYLVTKKQSFLMKTEARPWNLLGRMAVIMMRAGLVLL